MVDLSFVTDAITPFYAGVCTVSMFTKSKDNTTKLSSLSKTVLYSEQPCRISFSKVVSGNQTDTTDNTSLGVRLFISNTLDIPSGADITVVQDGVTYNFASSGIAAVYPTHQEIVLESKEVYA